MGCRHNLTHRAHKLSGRDPFFGELADDFLESADALLGSC